MTSPGVFPNPLAVEDATGLVDEWLNEPTVVHLQPGVRCWSILKGLLDQAGTAGNLTTDAHLAALAIEHGATLYSADNDFKRLGSRLRFNNPLED